MGKGCHGWFEHEAVIAGDSGGLIDQDTCNRYRRTTPQKTMYTKPVFSVQPNPPHCPFVRKTDETREGADAGHKHA